MSSTLHRFFVPVLLFFSFGVFSFGADVNSWKNADIYGGQILSLAMHPANHNILLAGGTNTIYKSIDNAKTWQKKGIDGGIHGIAFAPSNPNVVYVSGGTSYFYRSTDSGETWVGMQPAGFIDLGEIACDPSDENTVYVCTPQSSPRKVYKSTNGGASWNLIYDLPAGFTPSRIAAVTSNVIIVMTYKNSGEDGAIFRSEDAGGTWTQIGALDETPSNCMICSMAVDPANPNNIYAGGRRYFFKSTDMGVNWSKVDVSGTLNEKNNPTAMLTVKGGSELLACNQFNLFKSTDSGDTWSLVAKVDPLINGPLGPFPDPIYDSTGGFLYLADSNGRGIYKSTDCVTFTNANTNIKGVRFLFVAHNPIEKNIFYAGSDTDLYRSTDTGNSWTNLKALGGFRSGTGDIIVHPSSSNVVFMCQPSTGTSGPLICKSTDYGDTWQKLYALPSDSGEVIKFAFNPADHDIMYAGVGCGVMSPQTGDGLYKSSDGGNNWTRIYFEGSVISNIAIDPRNPSVMYAGKGMFSQQSGPGTNGAYKSIDGGNNWQKLVGIPDDIISGLMIDPENTNIVYIATFRQGIYKSIDAGNTWNNLSFSPGAGGGIQAFTITKSTDGQKVLCVATAGGSIYISGDGENWQLYTDGFNCINVLCPGSLYAGTSSGLYSTDIILQVLDSDFTEIIKVYPNPFNPKKHTNGLTFANLPVNVEKIKIYNIVGEHIRDIDPEDGQAKWNGKNESGNEVTSGVYIAVIKSSEKTKKVKIAVER